MKPCPSNGRLFRCCKFSIAAAKVIITAILVIAIAAAAAIAGQPAAPVLAQSAGNVESAAIGVEPIVAGAAPVATGAAWETSTRGRSITCLASDLEGCVWIGTEGGGVWRRSPPASGEGAPVQFKADTGLGDDNCLAVVCDRQGRIWVGTQNHGVSVFNGQKWKSYGLIEGLPGLHVTALAVSPIDGDVWGATEGGLFCYVQSLNTWLNIGRSQGLPSTAVNALAFSRSGYLIVGTQADGIAIRAASEGAASWRAIAGPERMTNSPSGQGLPSKRINCLCVSSEGTIYAGTPDGLGRSSDNGKTWTYVRGADWQDRVSRLYPPLAPARAIAPANLLREDYVTCCAPDGAGRLLVGHWRRGMEAITEESNKILYRYPEQAPDAKGHLPVTHIQALLPLPNGTTVYAETIQPARGC